MDRLAYSRDGNLLKYDWDVLRRHISLQILAPLAEPTLTTHFYQRAI